MGEVRFCMAEVDDKSEKRPVTTDSWEQFKKKNTTASRQQVLEHMRKLDEEYGRFFVPPLKKGER